MKKTKERGITLIALIITIVVILILVAVTISITLGENGIIKKAQEARTGYTGAEETENTVLTGPNVEEKINTVVNGGNTKISTNVMSKGTPVTMAAGKSLGNVTLNPNPTIPSNYAEYEYEKDSEEGYTVLRFTATDIVDGRIELVIIEESDEYITADPGTIVITIGADSNMYIYMSDTVTIEGNEFSAGWHNSNFELINDLPIFNDLTMEVQENSDPPYDLLPNLFIAN